MKKLIKVLLCVLLAVSVLGCQRRTPEKALQEFLKSQKAENYTTGEVTGSVAIGNGLQSLPVTFSMKFDAVNKKAEISGNLMGMMEFNAVFIDKVVYSSFMGNKVKIDLEKMQPTTVSATAGFLGNGNLGELMNFISNVTVTKEGTNTIYEFDLDVIKLMNKLPTANMGNELDELKNTVKTNPHVKLVGAGNSVKSMDFTWELNNGLSMKGSIDMNKLGQKVQINEPADKDSYVEVNPQDLRDSLPVPSGF